MGIGAALNGGIFSLGAHANLVGQLVAVCIIEHIGKIYGVLKLFINAYKVACGNIASANRGSVLPAFAVAADLDENHCLIFGIYGFTCGVNKADSDFRPLIFAVKLSVGVHTVRIAVGIGKLVKRKSEPAVLVCVNNRRISYCLFLCFSFCFCHSVIKCGLCTIKRVSSVKHISKCSIALP